AMPSNDLPQVSKRGSKKSNKPEQVYCYCREPADDRFMIECDECDEWYHGNCIQLTSTAGRKIDKYYCPSCFSKNPDLVTTYKNKGYDRAAKPVRCNECAPCTSNPDCGKCARCKAKDGRCMEVECIMENLKIEEKVKVEEKVIVEEVKTEKKNKKKKRQTPRRKVKIDEDDEVVGEEKRIPRGQKGWKKQMKDEKKKARKGKGNTEEMESENYRPDFKRFTPHRNKPFQCWGPGCVYEARKGSKFCSDDCGKALARKRLESLNKKASDHWEVEPVDERIAREAMDRLANEMEELKEEIEKLGIWHKLIIDYVETFKPLYTEADVTKDTINERKKKIKIYCVVCGVDYDSRVISKHIVLCFKKKEKRTTFGEDESCIDNPHNILCQTFDEYEKTYCMRLRVLCAEHYNGDIEEDVHVCGWPKVWSVEGTRSIYEMFAFEKGTDIIEEGLCTVARKECKQHYGWITTVLGLIDGRRLEHYIRMDEIEEELEEMREQAVKRGNAWMLMSNQTEYHQPLEQILAQYEDGSKKAGVPPPLSPTRNTVR
ncbi:hypothetical protein PENTCL1PPCAC_25302, partial [Pristionchus entomophagus]